MAAARGWCAEHQAAILNDFAELLRIPNVAGDRENIERNAAWLEVRLAALGASVEWLEQDGASPVVLARLPAQAQVDSRDVLGVYIHYDGQPVTAASWRTPPWEPVLATRSWERGGEARAWPAAGERLEPECRIYARSAGDDKAPVIAWLAALSTLEAAGIPRTVDLVFFLEGEEEAGSPHLARYLEEHRARLEDIDVWLFCDGPVHQSRRAQLVFGVRGIASLELTVYGADRGLHSGHYGNWAPNAGMLLAELLASMKDERGRVTIAGFYDDVHPLSEADRAALARLPRVDEALMEEFAFARPDGEHALAEAILAPALNVRGLACAQVGEAARNVIPPEAVASIDLRLVAGCDPARMTAAFEAHVRAQGYHVVREAPDAATRRVYPRLARIRAGAGYPAARTPIDHPAVAPIIDAARRAAGDELLLVPGLGGSLPLHLFTEGLGKPIVIVPIANHDDNQHAPDENLRLQNLWDGAALFAALATS